MIYSLILFNLHHHLVRLFRTSTMAVPASARDIIVAMEIKERGMAPDTPTPNQQMPSPISVTAVPPLLVEARVLFPDR